MSAPRAKCLIVLAVAVPAAWGCATAQSPGGGAPLGCYYFDRGAAAEALALPWGVRLLDRPLEGWPALATRGDVRVATTLTGRDEADHPFGYWVPVAGDSLEIGYPAGGGLLLRLAADDRGLAGTARPVGDALPLGASGQRAVHDVSLLRALCPDEATAGVRR